MFEEWPRAYAISAKSHELALVIVCLASINHSGAESGKSAWGSHVSPDQRTTLGASLSLINGCKS